MCIDEHIYVCVYTIIHICIHIHMYVYICIYTYISKFDKILDMYMYMYILYIYSYISMPSVPIIQPSTIATFFLFLCLFFQFISVGLTIFGRATQECVSDVPLVIWPTPATLPSALFHGPAKKGHFTLTCSLSKCIML